MTVLFCVALPLLLLFLYEMAIVDMVKNNQQVEKTCPPHLVERHIVSVKPYLTKATCRQPGARKP